MIIPKVEHWSYNRSKQGIAILPSFVNFSIRQIGKHWLSSYVLNLLKVLQPQKSKNPSKLGCSKKKKNKSAFENMDFSRDRGYSKGNSKVDLEKERNFRAAWVILNIEFILNSYQSHIEFLGVFFFGLAIFKCCSTWWNGRRSFVFFQDSQEKPGNSCRLF